MGRVMVVVALGAAALSGCQSIRAATMELDARTCESYGFTPETTEFSQCLMTLDQQRREIMMGS